jgi:hypothetical protein
MRNIHPFDPCTPWMLDLPLVLLGIVPLMPDVTKVYFSTTFTKY